MECQFFQWLIAGAGPTTLQHALVGIGCLLAYDVAYRWRKERKAAARIAEENQTGATESGADEWRRAA